MNKMKNILVLLAVLGLVLTGCDSGTKEDNGKINVVTTTNIIADLVENIGGEHVDVTPLMQSGVDPHLYQASAGDVTKMQDADIVIYNGLHLEGKMTDVFDSLSGSEKDVIVVADGLDQSDLRAAQDEQTVYDPHIWFDITLWKKGAIQVEKQLSEYYPEHQADFKANLDSYLIEMDELEKYVMERAQELTDEERVLVTAHDAFAYFADRYGFEVMSLQGINTDAEAGTADVRNVADYIIDHQVKAIFIESSVPPKTIEALQAAVQARDFNVEIGGELYSDSLGDEKSGAETYIKTVKANIDTIVNALK